ncbi:MAG: TRAP transporter small permease [Pseudomonadota bacterium]
MMKTLKLAGHLPGLLAAAALFALMCLTFADVMLRSTLNAPIQVTADLTRVLMAIMVFSVAPLVSWRGEHITVDLLDGLFDRFGLRRWIEALVALGCGTLLIWPALRVFDLAERSRSYGDIMIYLKMPVHYTGWFISALTLVTAAALILRALALTFRPQLIEDHAP